jgi:hypothetical protein
MHQMQQFFPIILCWVLNTGTEEGNCRVDIGPSTFARKQTFGNENMENVGTMFVQGWRIPNLSQIGGGGCGCGRVSQVNRKIVEHSFDIVPHVHCNAFIPIDESHAEIIVNLSSGCFFVSILAIFIIQPLEKLVIDFWVNVA